LSDDESKEPAAGGRSLLSIGSPVFGDVRVTVKARLGEMTLTIHELLALQPGSVLKLDLRLDEPVELRLNESVVARGEIVAVDDHFGIRIVELAELS